LRRQILSVRMGWGKTYPDCFGEDCVTSLSVTIGRKSGKDQLSSGSKAEKRYGGRGRKIRRSDCGARQGGALD